MHTIPSLTCSEPGCAGKHCYHARVCTVVHYAVLEAIRAVCGIWQS